MFFFSSSVAVCVCLFLKSLEKSAQEVLLYCSAFISQKTSW